MALSTTTNRVSYSGNGTTTAFSFPYLFFADGDLTVILVVDATGAETTQTLTTDYTVSGAEEPSGGTVTMNTAPASGETLIIFRDVDQTQEVDLRENDALPAEELEQALDRTVMQVQRLNDRVDRTVALSDGFTDTFDLTLPSDLATANSTIVVNAAADGFELGPTTTEIEDAEAEATAAAASASAAAASETNAEDWATKTDGIVESTDYSAKAWSIGGTGVTDTASRGASKEWATETASTVDGTEYSSKEYAQGTQTRGASGGGSAKDWATYTGGTVDDTEFSAKYWAQQAAANIGYTKVSVSHTTYQTAALTNSAELFSLAANKIVHNMVVKTTTAFAGSGITGYVLNIGISGDADKFLYQFDLTAAASNSNYAVVSLVYPAFGSAVSIQAQVTSTGANLDQSTAGAFDLYYLTRDLE